MKRNWGIAAGVVLGVCLFVGLFVWYYVGTREFMENMGAVAAEKASETLGVRTEVGAVRIDSLHSLTIKDITLWDKKGAEIAKAESATVGFSFFGVLGSDPVKAVHHVDVNKGRVSVEQRSDGSWNYRDLISDDSEESSFAGTVNVEHMDVTVRMDGKEIVAESLRGSVDFSDSEAMKLNAKAFISGAEVSVEGTVGTDIRMSVEGKNADIRDYLSWIPQDTLPNEVNIKGGRIDELSAVIQRKNGEYSANGKAKVSNGEVRVYDTDIRKIKGIAEISGKTVSIFLGAEAEEQRASLHGKIFLGGDEPRLHLVAESQSFDPSRVMADIPYHGALAFTADISGTPSNPSVKGEVSAKEGEVYGYRFSNAKAYAAYEGSRIVIQSLKTELYGGKAEVSGEFDAESLGFNGHVKLFDVDSEGLGEAVGDFRGKVSGDLGIAGKGNDVNLLSVYGSISAKDAVYKGISIPKAEASFYFADNSVIIDYADFSLENGGEIGVEGTIAGMETLDLSYYVTHLDLSLLKNLEPAANMTGFADFDGVVRGPVDNPFVKVRYAAAGGKLFEQPYRSLHGSASGSLDGISIDSFSMENDGNVNWLVQGTVGFTGARRVNLTIDTTGVRMEDIAALVAPNLPITGNVDNIITITGTLDDPEMVGYIHFYRGSYNGYLLSGMDGDYTMKNGVMTLHDFHIFSPLVDMDLNGTIERSTQALNLKVEAHDIDLKRFENSLPYPVSGHGKFEGLISGTVTAPAFDGKLTAETLEFNGEPVTNVVAQVTLRGNRIVCDPIRFEQKDGIYKMNLSADLKTERLSGRIEVQNGDINGLMAIGNVKNDTIHGHVDGTIDLSGTFSNPVAKSVIFMKAGDIGGYAVTDTIFVGSLSDRVIAIEKFEGEQGTGRFAAVGMVDLDGEIEGRFSAQDIAAGMIPAAAGSKYPLKGSMNIEAQFGGTVQYPTADASVEITSGGAGKSAFDTMTGLFRMRGPVIEVQQFVVQKNQAGKLYKASAYGMIPLRAVTSSFGEQLEAYDQMNLRLSLDNGDLGLLPFISDSVDWAVGETQGTLLIGGTLAEPSVVGSVGIKNASVKLSALEVPFTELNLGVNFAGDTFTITEGRGNLGRGNFTLEGSMKLEGHTPVGYGMKLKADNLDIQSAFYRGPLSVSAELGEDTIFGRLMPKLTVRAVVNNCTISVPMIPESESEFPNMILDVGIDVGKYTHFYSNSLYDIWLQGNIHYGGTVRHPAPSGTVTVRRGTVTYLQTVFKIRQGEAYFNRVGSFLPSLSFHADTRLSRTKVFLGIEGPVDEMKLNLSSSPEMSREEILKVLTMRGAYKSGQNTSQSEWAAMLGAGLQMSFLGDVEDTIRDFLTLDELVVVQDDFKKSKKSGDKNSAEGYNVKLGKYITDKVMLEYTQGINQNVSRFFVKYEFDDRLSVFAGRREESDNIIGFEGRFRF
ncbi:MAG: translocation/assembly module TamB domain-containing protein [Schwartzia sp.]|nr:translocation/assembly module TamB domain-containing protein [Schwartzia sp. (in: firmicutes)]